MTPSRLDEYEELLECLLERSESDLGLDADELPLVVWRLREVFDDLIGLAVLVSELYETRSRCRRLLARARSLRSRCALGLMFLERGQTSEAIRVLGVVTGRRAVAIPDGEHVPVLEETDD